MYKVFRRDCLHRLAFECNRFDFDFELVIKLLRKGYVPLEIAVNYNARSFSRRQEGVGLPRSAHLDSRAREVPLRVDLREAG